MGLKWKVNLKELKKVSYVAAPMVAVTVLQYLLQVVSMVMVGHLDELSLSGVSIATSFTSVTGFSFLFGMAGALETVCGQAYGAEQYQKLGTYTYSAIISLILVCIPISLLWMFTDKLLILIGQDPSISHAARKYSVWLIPNLVSYAVLQALIRYFQTQSLIIPMLFSSFVTLCFHIPFCWVLVFKTELGCVGAALAISVSYWLNVFLLGLYMKYSSMCKDTRSVISMDMFLSMKEFFRFALPSAVMTCFTITYLHYFIPYGFGATASTRVSNELGAGNPQAAKVAISAIMILALAEVVIISMALFFCRHILGYAISNEKEIVDHVADMAPFLCLSIIMDGSQAVLSGVARGSGWQHIGAYVNLGAYYLVGTPVGAVLAFVAHLKGKGLLIGLATGSFVQATLLALMTIFTNWEKQVFNPKKLMLLAKGN
ncbi:protein DETOXIFICATION 8 isoform X3 [Hevea brasiliensis]|uniref:protein DETOXIFICATION 8 isoform X3 n=1 Tax=Hevea brasiliensis TaxID=3981 RepID=UPI0025D16164|nr:protein DETOXIFICATION 8 isoform X3 [Hevea brasiliensis]